MGAQLDRFEAEFRELLACVNGLAAEPSPTVLRLKDLALRVEAALAAAGAERETEAAMARLEAQRREVEERQRTAVAEVEARARAGVEQATVEALRAALAAAEGLAARRRAEAEVLLTFSRSKIEGFYGSRRRVLESSRASFETTAAEATRKGGAEGQYLADAARRGLQLVTEELADLERKEALIRRATLGL